MVLIATVPSNFVRKDILPAGVKEEDLGNWLNNRFVAKRRGYLAKYLEAIGVSNIKEFYDVTYGVSLTDTYWVKPIFFKKFWQEVSPLFNVFDPVVQSLAFDGKGDYYVNMQTISPEFTTDGNFDKCWVREYGNIYLLKRGTDFASNSGLEPYCEVLASQVFSKMNAGIVYDITTFKGYIASRCKLFTDEYLKYVPFGEIYKGYDSIDDYLKYYDKVLGTSDYLRRLLICDAITLNTDRHLGNFGFLCNTYTNKFIKAAPGFDYNLSMLPYITNDEFANIDNVIKKFTPYIGNDFIKVAKALMTSEIRDDLLKLQGIDLQVECDEKFPERRLGYMTDIVNQRIDKILYNRSESYRPLKVEGLSNLYQYRLKFGITDDDVWYQQEQPRLFQVFGCKHLNELEEEIKALL